MAEEDDKPREKSLIIFGRDVSKIPCYRDSLLYGIIGGMCFGLGYFMCTSRPPAAANFAVYSFSLITLAYWIQCRYTFSRNRFEFMKMQELLQQQQLYEGTVVEKELDAKLAEKPFIVCMRTGRSQRHTITNIFLCFTFVKGQIRLEGNTKIVYRSRTMNGIVANGVALQNWITTLVKAY